MLTDASIDIPTGGLRPFAVSPIPETVGAAVLAAQSHALHQRARDMHADTALLRREAHLHALDERQRVVVGRSGVDLLAYLYEAGLSWTYVAKLVGVSVPAVQKWRRGDGMTVENRLKLALLVALLEWLDDEHINEPASWLEMPIKTGVAVSRMEMLLVNRYDLVVQMIPDEYEQIVDVDEVLDAFEPDWRSSRVDERFETFLGEDGFMSIRPRAE